MARTESNRASGPLEQLPKKVQQRLIGRPIHRRGGQPDLDRITVQPGH